MDVYGNFDLLATDRALSAYLANPGRLERARARFDRPIRTPSSAATTEYPSPDLRTHPQRRWHARRRSRSTTHTASCPNSLFDAHVRTEYDWFQAKSAYHADPEDATEAEEWERARANVRFRWVVQGIWRDEWSNGGVPFSRWKHEDATLAPSDAPEPEPPMEEEQEEEKGEGGALPKTGAELVDPPFGPRGQGGETGAEAGGTETGQLVPRLNDSSIAEAQGDDGVAAKQPAPPPFHLFGALASPPPAAGPTAPSPFPLFGTLTSPPPAPGPVGLFGRVAQPPRHPSQVASQEKPRPGPEGLPPWPQHDKVLQEQWLARRRDMLGRIEAEKRREKAQRIRAEVREHKRRRAEEQEERDSEASRPYHQFLAQVSLERERILVELSRLKPPPKNPLTIARYGGGPWDLTEEMAQWERDMAQHKADAETPVCPPADVNATAYERAKAAWTDWRIWNPKWGVLPGMSWQHELPLDEFIRGELGEEPAYDYESPRDIAAHEGLADFVARLRNFDSMRPSQSPPPHGLEPLSKPKHDGEAAPPIPASVVDDDTGASVPDSAAVDMAGATPTPAVATIRPPTPPISRGRRLRKGKQKGLAGPALRRGQWRVLSDSEADKSEIERSALGQASPSRVSKAYGSPQPAARGRRKAGRAAPLEEPDPSAEDTPAATPPRKSRRLLEIAGKRETDTEGAAGEKRRAARPRRQSAGVPRTAAASAAAKPQGVTKSRARRARGKHG